MRSNAAQAGKVMAVAKSKAKARARAIAGPAEACKPPRVNPLTELLTTRPSRAIDAAIDALATAEHAEEEAALLDQLAAAIYALRGLEELSGAPTFLDLFRGRLSRSDRRFIAACLMRALAANRDSIPAADMRKHVGRLVDDVVADRVFQQLGLGRDSDISARLLELPQVEKRATATLDRAISEGGDLANLDSFRNEFMRALQDPSVAVIIGPFLPEDVAGDFNRALRAVHSTGRLQTPEDLSRYHEAQRRLAELRASAAAQDNQYADRFMDAPAAAASAALGAAFSESPLSRPAHLQLRPTNKRYPLHREGDGITLSLEVANQGDGPAFDVVLTLEGTTAVVPVDEADLLLGSVTAEGRTITVPATVFQPVTGTNLSYLLVWCNADGTEQSEIGEVSISAQQANIDWDRLATENPYPNKAISDPDQLAGRKSLLLMLEALATGPEVGSTRVSGQKRVGKSSLVRSLQARLGRLPGEPLLVAYVDVNKLGIEEDRPKEAVSATMRAISREISRSSPGLNGIQIPDYSESLEPFAEFLDEVRHREPQKSILVIVDEFDELPNTAFERGGPGDPMFKALKSLSSEGECGFILVGGENLELALSRQADRLNAFGEIHVDYLGQEDPSDFGDLVVRPVSNYLEFETAAVEELRERTGGHPFFTLLVCRQILDTARNRADAHITVAEVNEAYRGALQAAPASTFAHIWFDHIFDTSEGENVVAARRIRLLLAWASCLRRRVAPTEPRVIEAATDYDLGAAICREELRSLVNRKILQIEDGAYRATSRFFEDWLREFGSEKIRAEQPEMASLKRYAAKEDERRIRSHELIDLTRRWPQYQFSTVGPEEVRAWLEQFGDSSNQRLALALLENLEFFPVRRVRESFIELHRLARRNTREDLTTRSHLKQRKRRDFVVAYMEPDGKSAHTMAQHYADANNISRECVIAVERAAPLIDKHQVQRVVIVDDFIGTGQTVSDRMRERAQDIRKAAEMTHREVLLAVVCGFEEGVIRAQASIDALALPMEVAVATELDRANRAFDESSRVFSSSEDRLVARRTVEELGRELGSEEPLGTGDLQALVVFEHNCPNNSLPVLWKGSETLPWKPLFARVTTT
jgi:hypothetical protein